MSLEDKINNHFTNFSIKSPDPKQGHPWYLEHLHADFIELRTLLWDKNAFLTLQDAITYYKDHDFDIDFEETNYIEDQYSSSESEKNDRWVTRFMEIFELIKERYLIYDSNYPFEIDGFSIKLKEELNEYHKLYLYLLIASNLNNFKELGNILTAEFETISKNALESYIPRMNVEEFGQNSGYKGNTRAKILALSEKLNLSIRSKQLDHISVNANKEKGLDLVGWLPFEDAIANMIIILGQCACGKDWTEKKSDTKKYEDSYIDFHKLKPLHALFIPYGLVRDDKDFSQADNANGQLLFERKRMLDLLVEKIELFRSLESYAIVEKCILHEDIEV